jgi:hypothetical protein
VIPALAAFPAQPGTKSSNSSPSRFKVIKSIDYAEASYRISCHAVDDAFLVLPGHLGGGLAARALARAHRVSPRKLAGTECRVLTSPARSPRRYGARARLKKIGSSGARRGFARRPSCAPKSRLAREAPEPLGRIAVTKAKKPGMLADGLGLYLPERQPQRPG